MSLAIRALPHDLVTGGIPHAGSQQILMGKKCKKAKWLSEEALQIAVKTREAKAKEKRKDITSECRVPKNSKKR